MSAPLSELSTTTGSLIRAFPAGPYGLSMPSGMALVGQEVWVADPFTNHLVAVRAATGALVQSLWGSAYRFDKPAAMAAWGDDLFVANEAGNCVTELSTATGALIRVICRPRFGFGYPDSLAVAAPTWWWPTKGRSPNRRARSLSSTPPPGALVRTLAGTYLMGPGDLLSSGGDVFVANTFQSPGSVTELDPATGQVLRTLAGGPYGFGDILAMAVWGTDLFVANLGSATTGSWVSEIDLASGKPARTLLSSPISAGLPEAMTTSGGDLFVSYRGARSGFGGGFGSAAGGSLTEVDVTSGATYESSRAPVTTWVTEAP